MAERYGLPADVALVAGTTDGCAAFGIYSHRIGDQWLAGGASNTGGAAIAKYFSRDEIARLTPLLDPDHPTGLDYYPLASPGERFPVNDPAFAPRLSPRSRATSSCSVRPARAGTSTGTSHSGANTSSGWSAS